MARPRYSAAKRQREMRKQLERQRKLARKHARHTTGAASAVEPDVPPAGEPGEGDATAPDWPGDPEPR